MNLPNCLEEFLKVAWCAFSVNHRRTQERHYEVLVLKFFQFFFCLKLTPAIICFWICRCRKTNEFIALFKAINRHTAHIDEMLDTCSLSFLSHLHCKITVHIIIEMGILFRFLLMSDSCDLINDVKRREVKISPCRIKHVKFYNRITGIVEEIISYSSSNV